jgi:hypothetical protein
VAYIIQQTLMIFKINEKKIVKFDLIQIRLKKVQNAASEILTELSIITAVAGGVRLKLLLQ